MPNAEPLTLKGWHKRLCRIDAEVGLDLSPNPRLYISLNIGRQWHSQALNPKLKSLNPKSYALNSEP